MKLTKTIDIDVSVTVDELAQCFCDMDQGQQAIFFNRIHEISETWKKPFVFQLQCVTDSDELTDDGRRIMELIGQYSGKQEG